jgi:hypothetical protein
MQVYDLYVANISMKIFDPSLDGIKPMEGLEIWEGKADNDWSGQVKMHTSTG